MPTTSALKAMHDLHSYVNDPPAGWSTYEAMTEVLANAITVGIGPTIVGTASSPNVGVLSVQGITSGTPLSVSDLRTVTPHFKTLGASASQVIPIGARGYFTVILTGTGTFGGEAVPAGVSISSSNTLAATVTVATDSTSSAFVSWET